MPHLERVAAGLRVLAHPHRLRMCELLIGGRLSVSAIAEQIGIASNAASQHLGIMKAHGLLASERDGKTVFYRVVDPRACWIIECIRKHRSSLGADRA